MYSAYGCLVSFESLVYKLPLITSYTSLNDNATFALITLMTFFHISMINSSTCLAKKGFSLTGHKKQPKQATLKAKSIADRTE